MTGYLTWNAGKGGIAWAAGAPSEDPGGPPTDETQDQEMKMHYIQTRNAAGTYLPDPADALPPPDEFVSVPLPKAVHLDPSRAIVLELFLSRYTGYANYYDPCYYNADPAAQGASAGPDPHLDVEVFANDVLIGGDMQSRFINWYAVAQGATRPTDPAGFATCRYILHPETLTLEKDTVLKIRITHVAQSHGFQYGLAGDHASKIRLGAFSDDEWIYRDPEGESAKVRAVPSDDGEADMGSAAIPASIGLGGGIALMNLRGRRPRASLLLLVLLMPALAGCVGSSATTTSGGDGGPDVAGSIKSTQIADPNGTLSKTGNGSIFGVIYDDLGFPVPQAHVSILGLTFFTSSDQRGRFSFEGLPAGVYRIRIDKAEFRSFEAELEVRAGFVNRPEIVLDPLVKKAAGDRLHTHDYWGGQDSIVLMDEHLPVTCGNGGQTCSSAFSWKVPPPAEDADYNSILPGTEDVEITISWDSSQIPRDKVGLQVQNNGDPKGPWNWTFLHPRESGKPFHYASSWELTDPGHQHMSNWNFQLFFPPQDYKPPTVGAIKGYHVRIVIHKGLVPVEPAHPDVWQGGSSVEVMRGMYTQTRGQPNTNTATVTVCTAQSIAMGTQCNYNWNFFQGPKMPIPATAKRLEVTFTESASSSPDLEWTLRYLTAADRMHYDYARYEKDSTGVKNGLTTVWNLHPTAGQLDPMYATKSAWYFLVTPTDQEQGNLEASSPTSPTRTFSFTLVAHKE